MRYPTLLPLAFALVLTACSPASDAGAPTGDEQGATPDPAAGVPAAGDPAGAPAPAPMTAAPAGGHDIVVPGAIFSLPASWIPQAPSSAMRLAQATIPGTAGNGELTVFHFGAGGGGGVGANLQRWADQIESDPGTEPIQDNFTLGAWKVSSVESVGTLKPSSMGTGPTEPQPGTRLLAAVVEGPGGPWFFKATGPSATIEAEREAFFTMVKSGRVHG